MKTIKINHIAKTEGHMSFIGSLLEGDIAKAKLETEEGARLFEGMVIGRPYYQMPVIVSRICGVCPIVHNLASVKAIENAFGIKVTKETVLLRKILELAQIIHSHTLHMYFLSFPDLVGVSDNTDIVKKYPKQSKLALEVRDWAVQMAKLIGGRTVHPINSVTGGFNVLPDEENLGFYLKQIPKQIKLSVKLFDFLKNQKIPKFSNPSNYLALKVKNEYAIYDGKVYFLDNKKTKDPRLFYSDVAEESLPYQAVKRAYHFDQPMMCGALARINCNFNQLNKVAKKNWNELRVKMPNYNPFHNILAQAAEVIHCYEECEKSISQYLRIKDKNVKAKFKVKEGRGIGVIEAPRGLLFHEYKFDKQGLMKECNILTPTSLFIANLEKDLEQYLPTLNNLTDEKRDLMIKTLIRAYDPCVSCATH